MSTQASLGSAGGWGQQWTCPAQGSSCWGGFFTYHDPKWVLSPRKEQCRGCQAGQEQVPSQLVSGERWQGDSGSMCLGGVGCPGAGRCQGCKPGPRSWLSHSFGRVWVLGTEPPQAMPPGNHLGPSMSCSSPGEPNSPKSLHKHPAVPTPCYRQVPALAPPSSVRLCTVKGDGDPAVPIPQPHHHPALQGHAHCWNTPRAPLLAPHLIPTDPAPALSQPWHPSLPGDIFRTLKEAVMQGRRCSPVTMVVTAPSPGSAVLPAGRAAAGSGR